SRRAAASSWSKPSRDRWKHVDPIARFDRGVLLDALAVDEHVDVPPEDAALVEDPAARRGMRALELAQQLPHRFALEHMLSTIARKLLEGPSHVHHRHAGILGESPGRQRVLPDGVIRRLPRARAPAATAAGR